jgi:hypothetical protein
MDWKWILHRQAGMARSLPRKIRAMQVGQMAMASIGQDKIQRTQWKFRAQLVVA